MRSDAVVYVFYTILVFAPLIAACIAFYLGRRTENRDWEEMIEWTDHPEEIRRMLMRARMRRDYHDDGETVREE